MEEEGLFVLLGNPEIETNTATAPQTSAGTSSGQTIVQFSLENVAPRALNREVKGTTVDVLFSSIGGSFARDYGKHAVLRFLNRTVFRRVANPGSSVQILFAVVFPLPLGSVLLASAL
ncbi:MAG: hypothetical protein AAGF94_03790 [Pseudomonadota bacterium]